MYISVPSHPYRRVLLQPPPARFRCLVRVLGVIPSDFEKVCTPVSVLNPNPEVWMCNRRLIGPDKG